jgi:rfaE bifunctional protein nucleotidyltransferase chain/domain
MGKIVSQSDVLKIRKACRRKGQIVVFTNGCFDIIHPGHVKYLAKAKQLGDVLIVGINSDKSVRQLKGKGRPVMNQKDRATILSHLDMVDYVTIFGTLTPRALIKKLMPDVLVKGADYKKDEIVGANEVEATGGKVVIIPFVRGRSTSRIISVFKEL